MRKIYIFLLSFLMLISCAQPVMANSQGKTPSGIPFKDMEKKIDCYIQSYIGKTTPGVAVVVVKDGKIIFSKGYGYGDIEKQLPVSAKDTVFEWGSVSKLFTWVSVMQLVEQGKLNLDEDIKVYLPEELYKKMNYHQKITLRDLMNHSAGFGDYAFDVLSFAPNQYTTLEASILSNHPKQYYEVGSGSAYSNYSTLVAGYIVERVSGQPFFEYEKEHILEPLHMDKTFNLITDKEHMQLLAQKAKGYKPDGKDGFYKGKDSYCLVPPAGALNGTAEDLGKYMIALMKKDKENILFQNGETCHLMLSPSYTEEKVMKGTYHGFMELGGRELTLGHGGNTAYFSSSVTIVPKAQFGICVLTNAAGEMDLTYGIQNLLLGNKQVVQDKIQSIKWPVAQDVEGYYVPMQREEGNFVDFFKYLALFKIKALENNKLLMQYGGFQGTYMQTAPYVYELIESDVSMFKLIFSKLIFKIKEDKVTQIVVGDGMDLSCLPQNRSILFLKLNLITLIVCSLFFLIVPIYLMIKAIKNKRQGKEIIKDERMKKVNLIYTLLVVTGTLTLINNLVCVATMLSIIYIPFKIFKPYIVFNYILLIATIMLGGGLIMHLRHVSISKRRWVVISSTLILLIALFNLLIKWHFFALVG